MKRLMKLGLFVRWCGRADSNPHGLATACGYVQTSFDLPERRTLVRYRPINGRNSSDDETFKALASRPITSSPGVRRPRSTALTYVQWRRARSAISSCDNPRSLRSSRTRRPKAVRRSSTNNNRRGALPGVTQTAVLYTPGDATGLVARDCACCRRYPSACASTAVGVHQDRSAVR